MAFGLTCILISLFKKMIEDVLVAVIDENVSDFCRNQIVVDGCAVSEVINLDHFDSLAFFAP